MPYSDFRKVLDTLPVTRIKGQDGSVADGSPPPNSSGANTAKQA